MRREYLTSSEDDPAPDSVFVGIERRERPFLLVAHDPAALCMLAALDESVAAASAEDVGACLLLTAPAEAGALDARALPVPPAVAGGIRLVTDEPTEADLTICPVAFLQGVKSMLGVKTSAQTAAGLARAIFPALDALARAGGE